MEMYIVWWYYSLYIEKGNRRRHKRHYDEQERICGSRQSIKDLTVHARSIERKQSIFTIGSRRQKLFVEQ